MTRWLLIMNEILNQGSRLAESDLTQTQSITDTDEVGGTGTMEGSQRIFYGLPWRLLTLQSQNCGQHQHGIRTKN